MFSRVTTTIILAKGIHFVFFRTGNNSNWQIVGLQVVFQSIFGLQFSLKKVLHRGGGGGGGGCEAFYNKYYEYTSSN